MLLFCILLNLFKNFWSLGSSKNSYFCCVIQVCCFWLSSENVFWYIAKSQHCFFKFLWCDVMVVQILNYHISCCCYSSFKFTLPTISRYRDAKNCGCNFGCGCIDQYKHEIFLLMSYSRICWETFHKTIKFEHMPVLIIFYVIECVCTCYGFSPLRAINLFCEMVFNNFLVLKFLKSKLVNCYFWEWWSMSVKAKPSLLIS